MASIHVLSIDKYYTNGDLNNGEALENKEDVEVNLSGTRVVYNERLWTIWGIGFKIETKSKTVNNYKNGALYTITIISVGQEKTGSLADYLN